MKKLFSYAILAAGVLAATAGPAFAGDLNLTIADGRVTIIANEVPVRQILAEWARVGQTKVVNAEKMMGPPLTIELRDVPEAQALETLLRSAAGYVVAPRMAGGRIGSSTFDSIVILATSRAPAVSASAQVPFSPRPSAQPMMPPVDDDDAEEAEEVAPPPGLGQPGAQFPGPMPRNPQGNMPPQGPLTAPRPGQLPAAPPGSQANPYTPQQFPPGQPANAPPTMPGAPGARRPGGGGGN